jgi:hypothetical protein
VGEWATRLPSPECSLPFEGCASPIAEKEVNFKSDGLIQSQKWLVGFGLFGEIVVWDQRVEDLVGEEEGKERLKCCSLSAPDMPLDWASDGVEDEDPSFAILDAIKEDFHQVKKGTRRKTKGRRELLNLESSINYGDARALSRRRKGKA